MPQILNLQLLIPVGAAILLALRILYGRRPSPDGLSAVLRVAGYLLCIAGVLALVIGLTLWGAIVFLPVAAVIAIGAYVRSRRGNDQALLASLAAGAEAGLPLEEIVAAFAAEHPSGRAALVSRGLNQGRSLTQALRGGGVHLPAATAAMLGTAEARGNLGPLLRGVLEPLRPLEAAVNAATQRVLLCFICAWVWLNTSVFLMLKIVPVLDKMFEEFGLQLPVPFIFAVNLARFAATYLSPLLSLFWLASLTLLLAWAMRQLGFSYFPLTAWLRRRFDAAAVLHALSAGLRSEVPLSQLLRAIAEHYDYHPARKRLRRIAAAVDAGRDPWESFRRERFLTTREAAALRAAQECGNLPSVAEEISAAALRRLEYRIQFWTNLLYPLVLGVLGLGVLLIVTVIIMPLAAMISGLAEQP